MGSYEIVGKIVKGIASIAVSILFLRYWQFDFSASWGKDRAAQNFKNDADYWRRQQKKY